VDLDRHLDWCLDPAGVEAERAYEAERDAAEADWEAWLASPGWGPSTYYSGALDGLRLGLELAQLTRLDGLDVEGLARLAAEVAAEQVRRSGAPRALPSRPRVRRG
jgi:hypothetical protein